MVDQNREQSHSLREKSGASQAPHLSVPRKSVKASNSAQTKSGPTKRPSVKKRTGHVGRNVRNGRDARIAHNTQKGDSADFGASGASQIDFSRSQKQGEGFLKVSSLLFEQVLLSRRKPPFNQKPKHQSG